jgi:hypothetical protein
VSLMDWVNRILFGPDVITEGRKDPTEPPAPPSQTGKRLLAACIACIGFTVVLSLALWAIDAAGITISGRSGQALAPLLVGVLFAAWRWPDTILRPFAWLKRLLQRSS